MRTIHVIDSHTAGEPTRVVIDGGPDLGAGSLAEQRDVFASRFDFFRSAVVNEPRGSEVLVGALIRPSPDTTCAAGMIFFNNVGVLGMCGHGTIGVVVTLKHLGRIAPGVHRLDTPVGVVSTTLHDDNSVAVANVPSYRKAAKVEVKVDGLGTVVGDVAWGGNWFFLVSDHGEKIELANVDRLVDVTWRIRQALNQQGFPEVDHVELFASPPTIDAHSRNFVLCPGKAYDRSPCGTGTSAKLACLAADGKLKPGDVWIQESVLGTRFTGAFAWQDQAKGVIVPTIAGVAFVTSDAKLFLDDSDPFCWGIRTDGAAGA